ncbi:hypothetical protein AB1Y20_020572 [Prymnesium parvum]|uniref:3-oxo-5-alpha-steroid 4-dehydrogenase C-terminal domain-containing protein n=1 Tax=Prymnesium parvum TaxID=97485 RepID=A0AB34JXR0_PRYPA
MMALLLRLYLQHEAEAHHVCSALMVLVGCCVLLVELGFKARAPYGRYASLSAARWYGPTINPQLAWMFQESWSFTVPVALLALGDPACLHSACNQLLLAMFISHYANRTFVYPFRLRGGSRMPLGLCLLASAFCAFNGFVQGRMWSALVVRTADSLSEKAAFCFGISIWALGLAINVHSDNLLRCLRRPGETHHKIPRGGAFEYVSGANYFGEVLEWFGQKAIARLRPEAEPDRPSRARRRSPVLWIAVAALALLALLLLVGVSAASEAELQLSPPLPTPAVLEPQTVSEPASPLSLTDAVRYDREARYINIGLAVDEAQPLAILGLINSTISHCSRPGSLHFHLVVPQHLRKPIRQQLQSTFPLHEGAFGPTFRCYSLEPFGVRAKIVRHLRRREKETVFISPYRYAVAYLPTLLPAVRRVLWLHPNTLILDDVAKLYSTRLDGAPAAAVDVCDPPLQQRLNASHPAVASALGGMTCGPSEAMLLVDTLQWTLLDITSRVEFWMSLNLHAMPAYSHGDAHAPLLLAILHAYTRLPPEWGVHLAGRNPWGPRATAEQRAEEAALWKAAAVDVPPPVAVASRRHLLLAAARRHAQGGGGGTAVRAAAVHFASAWKPWHLPWFHGGGGASSPLCLWPRAEGRPASPPTPCAQLWAQYATGAALKLGWKALTPSSAVRAAAAAAAAAAAGGEENAGSLSTARIEQEAAGDEASDVSRASSLHVTVTVDTAGGAYGLVALINSTLSFTPSEGVSFHVFCRQEHTLRLSRQLGEAFSSDVSISISAPAEERLSKLAQKLKSLGIFSDPYDLPQLWVHQALPIELQRTLLLPSDALILTDAREIFGATLKKGVAAAVFEDCSSQFEQVFNYRHALFANKHARSSCVFDESTLLLDLRAWRRIDVPSKVLDVMGSHSKSQELYQHPTEAYSISAPLALVLDTRALRLPHTWLCRGLARDSFTLPELSYWHRHWGQQGVTFPLVLAPFRAPQAVALPQRAQGDALILRFNGGAYKPWMRRCSKATSDGAPRCGRGFYDCANIWWRFVARRLLRPLAAVDTVASGALRLPPTATRPCVPEPPPAAAAEDTDADSAVAAGAAALSTGINTTKVEVLGYFDDPTTGKRMVRRRVTRLVKKSLASLPSDGP